MKGKHNIPKFELRQSPDEGAILVGGSRGQRWSRTIEKFLDLGVNHGGEKRDQLTQRVDAQCIGDDIKALNEPHAQEIEQREAAKAEPALAHERSGAVEEVLVAPREGDN